MTARHQWVVLVVMICLCGCSADSPGTEAAARKHFDTEFKKWMAGQENSAATMTSKVRGLLDPFGSVDRCSIRLSWRRPYDSGVSGDRAR